MTDELRVPKGRPTGGQFAAHDRADADVTLHAGPALPAGLSEAQQRLLAKLRAADLEHGHLVSGHEYRTAVALERRGLATVRNQYPTMAWVWATAQPTEPAEEAPRVAELRQIDQLVNDVYPDAAWLEFEDYGESGGEGLAPYRLLNEWSEPIVEFDGDEEEPARSLGEALRYPMTMLSQDTPGVGAGHAIELHYV